MIRYLLSIVFIINLLHSLSAQSDFKNGFIVTNTGDTIKGFIKKAKIEKLNREVFFSRTEGGKSERFLPKDLKSFGIFPTLYFESHEVLAKVPNSSMMHQQLFLCKIHDGYASVFKVATRTNNAYFVKKQNDSVITGLYMIVQKNINNSYEKPVIDTVTEFRINEYGGEFYLNRNYIDTLKHFFEDWHDYKTNKFELTESNIIAQVKAYNEEKQGNFEIKDNIVKYTPTFSFFGIAPFRPHRDIRFRFKVPNIDKEYPVKSNFITGYELRAGVFVKRKKIGLNLELGFNRISGALGTYTGFDSTGAITSIILDVPNYNSYFIEANTVLLNSKISPYLGLRVGLTPKFESRFIVSFILGTQYQILKKNTIKVGVDWLSLFDWRPYSTLLNIGYQYRFSN